MVLTYYSSGISVPGDVRSWNLIQIMNDSRIVRPEASWIYGVFSKPNTPESGSPPNIPVMDSIRGTNITWDEILSNLAWCKKQSIKRDPRCENVHRNASAYWRSSEKTTNIDLDVQRIELAAACCAFNFIDLMAPAPSRTMYEWEKDYLSQGPTKDVQDTAWGSLSSVHLLTHDTLKVGQEVQFLIQLRTGRGELRAIGGDIVRLWLTNEKKQAHVSAAVTDNGNGSYLATVKLPWAGTAEVKANIAFTREMIRFTLYVERLLTMFQWIKGYFKNGTIEEATPCSSLPKLPAFPASQICNLTKENGGIPWYCGRPVKKELSCSSWWATRGNNYPSLQPLGPTESEIQILTESKRPFSIPTNLVLNVNENDGGSNVLGKPTLSCRERDLRTTFEDSQAISTGYFYESKWYPFDCYLPRINKDFVLKCIQNTTMIILGDSNARAQFDNMQSLIGCEDKIDRLKFAWHAPLLCENEAFNISIRYFPPKMPLYGSWQEVVLNTQLHSFITILDAIPAEGRYLIHTHQFLHNIDSHLAVYEARLRQLRAVIERLLARNPKVFVVFQPSHICSDVKNRLSTFMFDIQRTVMRGLNDRVMFVNTMDMTIAAENTLGHPKFSPTFTDFYLGHICGRF